MREEIMPGMIVICSKTKKPLGVVTSRDLARAKGIPLYSGEVTAQTFDGKLAWFSVYDSDFEIKKPAYKKVLKDLL